MALRFFSNIIKEEESLSHGGHAYKLVDPITRKAPESEKLITPPPAEHSAHSYQSFHDVQVVPKLTSKKASALDAELCRMSREDLLTRAAQAQNTYEKNLPRDRFTDKEEQYVKSQAHIIHYAALAGATWDEIIRACMKDANEVQNDLVKSQDSLFKRIMFEFYCQNQKDNPHLNDEQRLKLGDIDRRWQETVQRGRPKKSSVNREAGPHAPARNSVDQGTKTPARSESATRLALNHSMGAGALTDPISVTDSPVTKIPQKAAGDPPDFLSNAILQKGASAAPNSLLDQIMSQKKETNPDFLTGNLPQVEDFDAGLFDISIVTPIRHGR